MDKTDFMNLTGYFQPIANWENAALAGSVQSCARELKATIASSPLDVNLDNESLLDSYSLHIWVNALSSLLIQLLSHASEGEVLVFLKRIEKAIFIKKEENNKRQS
mgnify:CR=1 FL=1